MTCRIPPRTLKGIRSSLTTWYDRCKRDLPWRGSSDPYAVWVSEIMLQQTQVRTVIPYYRRFLERFPDVPTLARAPLSDVLKSWEGLGYYTRARNLHRAAQTVLRDHDGHLPAEPAQLRKLPGIGQYTAAAIASIAFGLDHSVLDGNVTRVLCRLFHVTDSPAQTAARKTLLDLAEALIPKGRAGHFNQAVMDLGATVCLPRNPACDACPLGRFCQARAQGDQAELPVKAPRKPVPHQTLLVALIRRRGRLLIVRRPSTGLLADLWNFPTPPAQGAPAPRRLAPPRSAGYGVALRGASPLGPGAPPYPHLRVTLHAFLCQALSTPPKSRRPDRKWVTPTQLDRFPFDRCSLKVIEALRKWSS